MLPHYKSIIYINVCFFFHAFPLMPLQQSSSMQNIDPSEKTQNIEFVQQFARLSITFTEDDIQRWTSCNGPGYEHIDGQGIVALITGDKKKRLMKLLKMKLVFPSLLSVNFIKLKPCRNWTIT